MRMLTFAKRNAKEILRDPLTLGFGLGFPVVLLLLLSALQANIPVPLFEIKHLAPGVAVFGLSFLTLFSATLISKDRTGAFLERLYTTPMTALDFLLGYTLPILPIALVQCVVSYLFALIFGLRLSMDMLLGVLLILPISLLFVALGLLFGTILNDKAVGGVCGALLTNLTAWLSGIWFDLELMGGVFLKIANILPFVHAVELERAVFRQEYSEILPHLAVVLVYAVGIMALAVGLFLRGMKKR